MDEKICPKCKDVRYTARIRMRIGRKHKTNTKNQLTIIIGQMCITCGKFTEDPLFKKHRIKEAKKD